MSNWLSQVSSGLPAPHVVDSSVPLAGETPATLSDEAGLFRVVIPAPRRWRLAAVLAAVTALWAVGTARGLVHLLTPVSPGQNPHWPGLFGLACWLLGLFALDSLLYLLS